MKVKKASFDAVLSKLIGTSPIPLAAIPKADGSEREPKPAKPAKKRSTR